MQAALRWACSHGRGSRETLISRRAMLSATWSMAWAPSLEIILERRRWVLTACADTAWGGCGTGWARRGVRGGRGASSVEPSAP